MAAAKPKIASLQVAAENAEPRVTSACLTTALEMSWRGPGIHSATTVFTKTASWTGYRANQPARLAATTIWFLTTTLRMAKIENAAALPPILLGAMVGMIPASDQRKGMAMTFAAGGTQGTKGSNKVLMIFIITCHRFAILARPIVFF